MRSEQVDKIAVALSKAQGAFPLLEKKSRAYNYKYADLAETLQAITKPLEENELSISHEVVEAGSGYKMVTTLFHSSGQSLTTSMPLLFREDGKVNLNQALGSAITYAKRYAIGCLLNLAADKELDDDGASSLQVQKVTEQVRMPEFRLQDGSKLEELKKLSLEFPQATQFILHKFNAEDLEDLPPNGLAYALKVFQNKKINNEAKELVNA